MNNEMKLISIFNTGEGYIIYTCRFHGNTFEFCHFIDSGITLLDSNRTARITMTFEAYPDGKPNYHKPLTIAEPCMKYKLVY